MSKSNIVAFPRRTRLPADWKPGAKYAAFAKSGGLDPVRIAYSFRDYWHAKAGADACKSDWLETWRNWCRRDGNWREPVAVLAPSAKAPKKRGSFFAIDRRAWAQVSTLGLNPMVCYLVMACGTQKDNRTTHWSARAVEKFTRISRQKAAVAITVLIDAGLLKRTNAPGPPKYWLIPAQEIDRCGEPAGSGARADGGELSPDDWIWLPNGLICGVCSEVPPVERLRQTQRAQNLRLFIDLYATHDLAANGGLHWREIREEYHREQVGQQGPYIIWGFQSIGVNTWPGTAFVRPFMTGEESPYVYGAGHEDGGWPVFWAAWQQLVDLGLVEMIGSLVEDDSEDAALIHPYAIRNGERAERRLAVAAHDAATAMLAPWQAHAADGQHLAPIMRHMPGVQMVGIARLKYRPHTSATQVWIAKMSEWEMLAADYDAIRVDRTGVHCQQVGGNRTTGTHG